MFRRLEDQDALAALAACPLLALSCARRWDNGSRAAPNPIQPTIDRRYHD